MCPKTTIMKRESVIAMLAEVNEAKKEVSQAFGLLFSAKERLRHALGDRHNGLWSYKITDYNLQDEAADSIRYIDRNAWKSVVDRLQVREVVSVKKGEELDRQLQDGELPPLTETNVLSFMTNLFNDMDSLLEDSAREVFNWLRPEWRTRLKTNRKNTFGLTNKVIIVGGMNSNWMGGYPKEINYYRRKHFQALDNVFHLLDGKGVAKHPDDLVTQIAVAGRDGKACCETEYFRCNWYKNSNLHIEFRRPDLVTALNKLAGSGQLKG